MRLSLPDCRAYEMVSPVNTEGQDATDPFLTKSGWRASVSGEAVTYGSRGNFAGPQGGTFENQFLSRRGPEGWSTQAITPLHHPVSTKTFSSYESVAFTPELTEGIASTDDALTSEAIEGVGGYGTRFGLYVDDFANDSYRYVNDPLASNLEYLNTVGTSTDLSHVVVSGIDEGAAPSAPVSEWVDGKVVLVSVTNGGKEIAIPVVGVLYSGNGVDNTWHAVSTDGSRVYFASYGYSEGELLLMKNNGISPIPGQLFVRVNAEQPQSPMSGEECTVSTDACTIEVSASQRKVVDPNGPQTAHYSSASADGSRVFFTSSAELTEDAYTGPADNAANLYEYDLERPAGERLKDLTVDHTDADGAAVQNVVQVSEDGSYVYFVADGDLAGKAVAGEQNLYVSHDGGAPTFIATTSAIEAESAISPDGSRLAFVSTLSLTGYENEASQEVYLYDAETEGLVCASCNPTGARPVGSSSLSVIGYGEAQIQRGFSEYRPHNLLEDGVLFFDSSDALVPHASDGRINVYEYEDGHIYPISEVAGGYESFFMDASPNGDNVFFGTADQLLPQDTSNNVAVYDARVDGGFPVSVPPSSCDNGDSCKPPPVPQPGVFGAPASATFSGPGNIPPVVARAPVVKAKAKNVKCKKGYEKKKDKCVKKPRKRAGKSSDRKGSK